MATSTLRTVTDTWPCSTTKKASPGLPSEINVTLLGKDRTTPMADSSEMESSSRPSKKGTISRNSDSSCRLDLSSVRFRPISQWGPSLFSSSATDNTSKWQSLSSSSQSSGPNATHWYALSAASFSKPSLLNVLPGWVAPRQKKQATTTETARV